MSKQEHETFELTEDVFTRWDKQLDCEGIDISAEKGKVDIIELEEFKLKLVSENGELLLECRIGDKYHQALLELGITKLLEDYLKE